MADLKEQIDMPMVTMDWAWLAAIAVTTAVVVRGPEYLALRRTHVRKTGPARGWGRNGKTTALYAFYDDRGHVLYVGISGNPPRRADEHMQDASWSDEIASMKILGRHRTRKAAEIAERKAISEWKPQHNIVHNGGRNLRTPEHRPFDTVIAIYLEMRSPTRVVNGRPPEPFAESMRRTREVHRELRFARSLERPVLDLIRRSPDGRTIPDLAAELRTAEAHVMWAVRRLRYPRRLVYCDYDRNTFRAGHSSEEGKILLRHIRERDA